MKNKPTAKESLKYQIKYCEDVLKGLNEALELDANDSRFSSSWSAQINTYEQILKNLKAKLQKLEKKGGDSIKKFVFLPEHCQNCSCASGCDTAAMEARPTQCDIIKEGINEDLGLINRMTNYLEDPMEDWEVLASDVERHTLWVLRREKARKSLLQQAVKYAKQYGLHLEITEEIQTALENGEKMESAVVGALHSWDLL